MRALLSVHVESAIGGRALDGPDHHLKRRGENERKAKRSPAPDAQGLVEFACECKSAECERLVKVPLYVYRRILEAGNQSLLQAGHHAFPSYRTIVSVGLMSIEERV